MNRLATSTPQFRPPVSRSQGVALPELDVDRLGDANCRKRRGPDACRALVLWAKEDVTNGVRPSMDAYGRLKAAVGVSPLSVATPGCRKVARTAS